jgi:HAD superfamily hydrolase (TIGR01458 family)
MTEPLTAVDGLLLDIDGVLATSWEPIPGSIEAMRWMRDAGIPFRLITNTTTHTQAELVATLAAAGFDVTAEEIVTAVVATAAYLREHHPGAPVYVLSDGDAGGDLGDVAVVPTPEAAEVIVMGGACEDFTYDAVNRIFRRLMGGAALIGMHRNLFWRTADGWELDGGAYLAGLEEASGVRATVCGKPAAAFFASALSLLGVAPERAVMVGDDITNDILGAQAAGLRAVQVRTGKFRDADRAKGTPDRIIDALAGLPSILGG